MSDGRQDKLVAVGEPAAMPELPTTIEGLRLALIEANEQIAQARASQSGQDKQWRKEKDRADALEAKLARGESEAAMAKRLDNIQKGTQEVERQLRLHYFTKCKCLDAGVDFELLADIPFADEIAAEKKISQVAESIKAASLREVASKLGQSTKPQAGADRVTIALEDSFKGLGR
jgi:hypothetical protein